AYDAPEHLPAIAVAIARAESFWELPVIGRFLAGGTERVATSVTPGARRRSEAARPARVTAGR
ncbi:MAG: hypothetical protein JWO62_2652, partial [Acidimicrobiaceae bacterium]|nr:hypothetical protein [Acidimicrobiaceae bacterium]